MRYIAVSIIWLFIACIMIAYADERVFYSAKSPWEVTNAVFDADEDGAYLKIAVRDPITSIQHETKEGFVWTTHPRKIERVEIEGLVFEIDTGLISFWGIPVAHKEARWWILPNHVTAIEDSLKLKHDKKRVWVE